MSNVELNVDRLQRFRPQPEWFAISPDGIHGMAHEIRVLIYGQLLASLVGDEDLEVDADVLGWAAAVHDTQRWDEGIDPDHGARAADWIESKPDLVPAFMPLDRVAYLCRWHVPPDHYGPKMTPELKVFKDADALDRWRIGDLDPSFLRTKAARQLLVASRELWESTHGPLETQHTFEEIIAAALGLGLVVA